MALTYIQFQNYASLHSQIQEIEEETFNLLVDSSLPVVLPEGYATDSGPGLHAQVLNVLCTHSKQCSPEPRRIEASHDDGARVRYEYAGNEVNICLQLEEKIKDIWDSVAVADSSSSPIAGASQVADAPRAFKVSARKRSPLSKTNSSSIAGIPPYLLVD